MIKYCPYCKESGIYNELYKNEQGWVCDECDEIIEEKEEESCGK